MEYIYANEESILYTLMRRSRCFVFDRQLNLRDSDTSKPKRTVTPFYVYVSSLHFLYIELCLSDNAKVIYFVLSIIIMNDYL